MNKLQSLGRKLIYLYMVTSLMINIMNIKSFSNIDSRRHFVILCTDWVVFVIMLTGMTLSRLLKRLDLVLPTLVIIMLKHYLVLFDIEEFEDNVEE